MTSDSHYRFLLKHIEISSEIRELKNQVNVRIQNLERLVYDTQVFIENLTKKDKQ